MVCGCERAVAADMQETVMHVIQHMTTSCLGYKSPCSVSCKADKRSYKVMHEILGCSILAAQVKHTLPAHQHHPGIGDVVVVQFQ